LSFCLKKIGIITIAVTSLKTFTLKIALDCSAAMEFQCLPVEIQLNVFEKLDLRSLLTISQLNHYFLNVANTAELWKYQCCMRGWQGEEDCDWKLLLQKQIGECRSFLKLRPYGIFDFLECCNKKQVISDISSQKNERKSGTHFWQPFTIEDANTSAKKLEIQGIIIVL
jgi:hypothetical protein